MNQNQYDEENMNKKYDEMFSGNLDGTRHTKSHDITIGEKNVEEDEGNVYKDIYAQKKQMEQVSSMQGKKNDSTEVTDTGRYNEGGYRSSGYHTDGYSISGYRQEKYRTDEELLNSPVSGSHSVNVPAYHDNHGASSFVSERTSGKVSVGDDNVRGSFRVTGNDAANISHAAVYSENSIPVSAKVSSRETGLSHKVQSTENGIASRMRSENPAFARGQADFTSYSSMVNSFGYKDDVIYEFGGVTNSKKELKELRKQYTGRSIPSEKLNYRYCLSDKTINIALSKYGVSDRELQAMGNHDVSFEKMSGKERKQFEEATSMRNSIMTKIAKGEALNSSEIAALQAIKQSKKYDFKGIRGGNLSDDKSSKWKKFKGENKETLGLSKKVISDGVSMAASGAKYVADNGGAGEGGDILYKSGKAVVVAEKTTREVISYGKAVVSGKKTNSLGNLSERVKALASSGIDKFGNASGNSEGTAVLKQGAKTAVLPLTAYKKYKKMKQKIYKMKQKAKKAAKTTKKAAKGAAKVTKAIAKAITKVITFLVANPVVLLIVILLSAFLFLFVYFSRLDETTYNTHEEIPEAEIDKTEQLEDNSYVGKICSATNKLWIKQKAYEKNLSDADPTSQEILFGIPLSWQKLPQQYPSIASSPGVVVYLDEFDPNGNNKQSSDEENSSRVILGYNFSKYWGEFKNTNYQYAVNIKNEDGTIKKTIHTSILAPVGMTGDLGTYKISDDYRVDTPPDNEEEDVNPYYEFPVNEDSEGFKNMFNDESFNENFVVTFEYKGSAYTQTFTANKETSYYRGKLKDSEDGDNNGRSKHVYNVENMYRAFISLGIGATNNYSDESAEFFHAYYSKLFDYVMSKSKVIIEETMKQADTENKTTWTVKYKGKKYKAEIPTPFTKVELRIILDECGIQDLIAGDDSTVEWFEENGSKAFTDTYEVPSSDGVIDVPYTSWESWYEPDGRVSIGQDMALRYIELSNDDWDLRFEGLIIPRGNAMSRIPSATINRIMKEIKENNGGKLSKTQESFLRTALEEVGKYTYNYGSRVTDTENPPAQLDCSGFVSYVLYKGGVDKVFTDRIAAQYADCYESVDYRAISPHFEKLTPGTLVSANKENGEGSSAHVVIYMGIFKWADEKEASPHFVECTTAKEVKDYKGVVKDLSGSMVSGAGNMEIIKGYLYACCPKGFIYGRED